MTQAGRAAWKRLDVHKKCSKCKVDRPLAEFSKNKNLPDGLQYNCKPCNRKYVEENQNKISKQRRDYRLKNKERLRLADAEQYVKRREIILKNKTVYARNKRRSDSLFRLKENLRTRCNIAVRKAKADKSHGTFKLLGCTPLELKLYLESKFIKGMSWENQGLWHVDHIRPCASFDLTDPEQQKQCFHYTNLQPLWAKDNLKKGSKWLHPVNYED